MRQKEHSRRAAFEQIGPCHLTCIKSATEAARCACDELPTQDDAAHELDVCSDDADESSIASLLFPDWTTVLSVFERIVVTG